MMPLPPRDSHAYALAARICSLTREAYGEIHDFSNRGDYRGAHAREDDLREEIFRLCAEFNKHEFRVRQDLEQELINAHRLQPVIMRPAPENE